MRVCARPLPPACTAGRGSAVTYRWVIFITAVSGVGEEGGEGEGQGSSHSSSLPKLGLAQPEAGPELEREPGSPAPPPQGPSPLAHLLPAALPSRSGQRGLPQPFLAFCFLPPGSVWVGLGRGGSGQARAPPSPVEAPEADGKGPAKRRPTELLSELLSPSQGRTC